MEAETGRQLNHSQQKRHKSPAFVSLTKSGLILGDNLLETWLTRLARLRQLGSVSTGRPEQRKASVLSSSGILSPGTNLCRVYQGFVRA